MSNNITNLVEFAKRRQEQKETETIISHDTLNIDAEKAMLMSIQHQLNHTLHKAMCSFIDLVSDGNHSFIRMLEILQAYYHGIFFPFSIFQSMNVRYISYPEIIDGVRKQQKDPSILIFSFDPSNIVLKDPDKEAPLCRIHMRLTTLDLPGSIPDVDIDDYALPTLTHASVQYQELFSNIIDITRKSGGRILPHKEYFMFFIPYSPKRYIQTVIKFQDNFSKKSN